MKATIDKLAMGTVEYEIPQIKVSTSNIIIDVSNNRDFEGEFIISSTNDLTIKGVVYSSDDHFSVLNPQFIGKECVIKYVVNTKNCKAMDKVTGGLDIVTNGGEMSLPFVINVLEESIDTSIGEIKNYFNFANLVQMSYEEAVKLFVSEKFRNVFLKDEIRTQAIYDALMKNVNKELALEEFLIAVNKKKAVTLSLSETSKEYKNIDTSISGEFLLVRDTWGYVDVDVLVEGDFLHNCKTKISKDDFAGNNYEYKYVISYNMLHSGLNIAKLTFKTYKQTLTYEIRVILENAEDGREDKVDILRNMAKLSRIYLEFRMGKMTSIQWAERVGTLVDEVMEIEPGNQMAKLIKIQSLMILGKGNKAGELLNEVAAIVIPDRNENILPYCYYLYVRALYKRNAKFTKDIALEIKTYYENGHDDWQMLWMLLYLDERYKQNPSLKFTMIKSLCKNACSSPVIYFDALSVINEQPGLLRVLDEFELRLLLFASKWKNVNNRLALRISELALEEKGYNQMLFRILENIYDTTPKPEILNAICSQLIKGNKQDVKYHHWYEAGIKGDLRLTKLFEYYIFSVDERKYEPMLKTVYMYFNYNADSIPSKKSYLYANVIKNREVLPDVYEAYEDTINKYGLEQIRKCRTGRELAVIYNHILKDEHVTGEVAINLPVIINTYEIICDNENINEVVVIHKEKKNESRHYINNNRAYIELYTEEPVLLFVDKYGNRYSSSINFKLKKLMKHRVLLDKCFELNQENENLRLHYVEEYIKYRNNPVSDIEIFKNILQVPNIRTGYKREITGDIIDYYFDNFDGEYLDDYLVSLDMENMFENTRVKAIEMMITRGLYKEVFPCLVKWGFKNIDVKYLLIFCQNIIEIYNYDLDDEILKICNFVFHSGNTNETVIKYMFKYYFGTTKDMIKLFKIGESLSANSEEFKNSLSADLKERLLVQMLFESYKGEEVYKVFKSYYPDGIMRKLKNAFFTYCAYNYFVKRLIIDNEIFDYMELELYSGARMPVICKISLLKYMSTRRNLSDKQIELCQKLMTELYEKHITFEFFKKFVKYFDVPFSVLDKTYIEYHTNPNHKVSISYTISREKLGNTALLSGDMEKVCSGVFVKEFPLFAGDRLDYYFNESYGASEMTTEGKSLLVEPVSSKRYESRYDKINAMILDNGDNLKGMEDDFYKKTMISEKLFEIL